MIVAGNVIRNIEVHNVSTFYVANEFEFRVIYTNLDEDVSSQL